MLAKTYILSQTSGAGPFPEMDVNLECLNFVFF